MIQSSSPSSRIPTTAQLLIARLATARISDHRLSLMAQMAITRYTAPKTSKKIKIAQIGISKTQPTIKQIPLRNEFQD
jgi:hypothetical protein